MMKKTIAYIAALAIAGSLNAQERVFTLKDCMEYAVSNSTKMQIQQADKNDDRIARRDAILAAFTPQVNANAYLYSNFGRAIDPETNTYVSTASLNNAYSVSAGITIFNGFSAINNLKITKTAMSMGLSEEQQTIDQICLATIEAYYNVVYYSQMTDILAEQVKTAEKTLHVTRRQEELGQKGYADIVQLEADLADKIYSHTDSRNKLNDALITLKDVMFWPVTDTLAIDTSFASEDFMPQLADTDDSTSAIIENAKATLPELYIAKGEMDNARLALRTAKWQTAPSLTLSGGWSTSYYTYPGKAGYVPTPFWNQFTNNSGEYIQLTLSIPIFDRLSAHSNISRKRNEYKRAEAQYRQKSREVEAEVMRAVQDRDGARSAFVQAERRSDVQEEAFRLNSKKFEQGLISSIEYQTASDKYLQAKAERLNALLTYRLKNKVVSYYNGIPYLQQEQ